MPFSRFSNFDLCRGTLGSQLLGGVLVTPTCLHPEIPPILLQSKNLCAPKKWPSDISQVKCQISQRHAPAERNFVKVSDSDTQTMENVAQGKCHAEYHDTFGRDKRRNKSLRASAGWLFWKSGVKNRAGFLKSEPPMDENLWHAWFGAARWSLICSRSKFIWAFIVLSRSWRIPTTPNILPPLPGNY